MPCMKREPRYPVFYADIQKNNNKRKKGKKLEIKESEVAFFNCPMDILYRIIDEGVIDLRKHKDLNTINFLESEVGVNAIFEYNSNRVRADRKQYKKIISIIREYGEKMEKLDCQSESDSYSIDRLNEFEICMEKLRKLEIKEDAMYSLIAYAFEPGNEDIRDSMLTVLYDKDKVSFLECFKKSAKSPQKNEESLVV